MSNQDELVEELRRHKFEVTQSTISRDLRRLGAVKTLDAEGNTVYRLADDVILPTPILSSGLKNLILDIKHNGSMIVIQTAVGSANLIARHLDQVKPDGILGTIAGDDTIFVAPVSTARITKTIEQIYASIE